jgi:muramoyltetrapeptide carboxypeptidase
MDIFRRLLVIRKLNNSLMIFPEYLQKGDRIRIVAPAGKVSKEKVLPGIELLQDVGYEVIIGKHVFDRHFQYAGTDQQRTFDFQEAINDPQTKAIVCARGGYGSVRIIEKLDFSPLLKNPKWLVGFSDITVFHSVITSGNSVVKFESHSLNCNGGGTGELVGGNLSLLYSLQGTPWQLDPKGKILLIEDLSEYLYHLDRMMQNFRLSGQLNELAGLVVGGFTEMQDNESPYGKSAYEIIREAVDGCHFPVCFDFPSGHISKNLSLVLGANYKLEVGDNCTLKRIQQ